MLVRSCPGLRPGQVPRVKLGWSRARTESETFDLEPEEVVLSSESFVLFLILFTPELSNWKLLQ